MALVLLLLVVALAVGGLGFIFKSIAWLLFIVAALLLIGVAVGYIRRGAART
jgi:hypothetical protein